MVSSQKLEIFLSLQQKILDIQDNSELIEKILPTIISKFSEARINYEFLSSVFIGASGETKKSFFVEAHNLDVRKFLAENIINLNPLLNKSSSQYVDLTQGKIVIESNINDLIFNTYFDFSHIRALLISPIRTGTILTGLLMFATKRDKIDINQEEIELIDMVTNLISISYRLEDTQNSLIDITKQVYEMNAQLHQLDKLKDDFVSIASHELRTPMTAIRSYSWMALYRSDIPLTPKLKRYLERTLLSTERLINLVNDMLNISRIETGRIEIVPKAFDLITLVKDVIFEVGAKAKENTVNLNIKESQIPQVFADMDKLHQVLLNLIGNSLKFTPHDGSITISFFSDGKVVEVSITDTGVGISKDDLSRLFTKFGRLDNSYVAAATSGGTGLGLYICKKLIELMGGKIWAISEGIGKGTTFTFSLPVATPSVLQEAAKYTKKVEEGEAKTLEPVAI